MFGVHYMCLFMLRPVISTKSLGLTAGKASNFSCLGSKGMDAEFRNTVPVNCGHRWRAT